MTPPADPSCLPAAPAAWFPDAGRVEASLRLRARLAGGIVLTCVAAVIVALGLWLGTAAAVAALLVQVALAASTVLRYARGARRLLQRRVVYPVTERTHPQLARMVGQTSARLGIDAPPAYILEDNTPNAFAALVGLGKPIIVFHTGLLKQATPQEVLGVTAHELAHVANRDVLVSGLVHASASLFTATAKVGSTVLGHKRGYKTTNTDVLLLLPRFVLGRLVPLTVALILLSVSRSRESLADLTAARALGGAQPVLDCLALLARVSRKQRGWRNTAEVRDGEVVRTHPALDKRIALLLRCCGRQVSRIG